MLVAIVTGPSRPTTVITSADPDALADEIRGLIEHQAKLIVESGYGSKEFGIELRFAYTVGPPA